MQRIKFRSFIFFFLLAAGLIAAGVTLYWKQVSQVLSADVKTHISAASEEAAQDFNRLIQTDRQVLRSIAVMAAEAYP